MNRDGRKPLCRVVQTPESLNPFWNEGETRFKVQMINVAPLSEVRCPLLHLAERLGVEERKITGPVIFIKWARSSVRNGKCLPILG